MLDPRGRDLTDEDRRLLQIAMICGSTIALTAIIATAIVVMTAVAALGAVAMTASGAAAGFAVGAFVTGSLVAAWSVSSGGGSLVPLARYRLATGERVVVTQVGFARVGYVALLPNDETTPEHFAWIGSFRRAASPLVIDAEPVSVGPRLVKGN